MTTDTRPPAIFLMGPTASGKTGLACALSDRFPMELVSVDSALVYRGFNIGTAKPDAATLAHYPHWLIDIRDADQPYSAADFREDALAVMDDIRQRGNIPLLTGGTGLYFRALENGLSPLPSADPRVREKLAEQARQHGWPAMHQRLQALDPDTAARIKPNDSQRIQRALEVITLSQGRRMSDILACTDEAPFPYRVLKLVLLPDDRSWLHERIQQRFTNMLEGGFLQEVENLLTQRPLSADLPAWRSVGYRQAREYLTGTIDYADFVAKATAATRQLAKRQITWLRREANAQRLDPQTDDVQQMAVDMIKAFIAE